MRQITTETNVGLDCWQQITTADGLMVHGTQRIGFHVTRADGLELAHMTEPGLDAFGALTRYRQQCTEAEREKASE